ncbi:MAG TPA: hypothetical protein VFR23_02015 [Jiangellaceae bacterium]|nr:hypothetical protein [Jiangellaceae bacterium]
MKSSHPGLATFVTVMLSGKGVPRRWACWRIAVAARARTRQGE